MDELILRHLRGETSDIEERQLAKWMDSAPANAKQVREMQASWSVTEPSERDLDPVPPTPSVDEIIAEAEDRRSGMRPASVKGPPSKRPGSRRLGPWIGLGLAAATAALALFGPWGSDPERASLLAPVESVAGGGDATTMSLSDGSVVRLASASSLEFPPTTARREVVLQGRAFFAVAGGADPFLVRTSAGEVTVLGTRFEVSQTGEEMRVVVVEGEVRVGEGADSRVLRTGEVAYASAGSALRVERPEDVWSLLAWEGGLLLFHETPLSDVAEELSRHFGVPVEVGDADLSGRRITAWFGDEELEEVVSAVCLVAGVACRISDVDVLLATPGR